MFEYIYNNVFPAIGYFFGLLIRFASMTLGDFLAFLVGSGNAASFDNVLTGEHVNVALNAVGFFGFDPIGNLVSWATSGLSVMSMPVWVAFLIMSVTVLLVFRIIKTLIPLS